MPLRKLFPFSSRKQLRPNAPPSALQLLSTDTHTGPETDNSGIEEIEPLLCFVPFIWRGVLFGEDAKH